MEFNQNRLRFVHCEHLFHNIGEIKDYVLGNAIDRPALYAEPMVFKYGSEKDPDIVLAIGSVGNGEYRGANRVYFIDFTQVEKDVAKAVEIAGASAEELKRIQDIVKNITKASGFNEKGEYLPEINDRILSKATSLSVADKILSDYIKDLEKKQTLREEETNSVKVSLDKQESGVTVSADVKLGTKIFNGRFLENMIVEQKDGLFSNVDLEYLKEESKLRLTINGDKEKELVLPEEAHLVSGEYDPVTENLVLKLNKKIENNGEKTDKVVISMGKLINEWGVLGEASETPIVLTKDELKSKDTAHDGLYEFKDVLKADVRIVDKESMPTNILKKDSSGRFLYVDGSASNITYVDGTNKISVQEALDNKLNRVEYSKHDTNILTLKEDGLFASVDVEYNSVDNVLIFKRTSPSGEVISKPIKLMTLDFIEKAYYDASTEEIVIIYRINDKTMELRIPMQIVVNSFDVDNSDTNVKLTKITNEPGTDKLKADVKIAKNKENILEDVGHALFVRGTADNINYKDTTTVFDALELLNGTEDLYGSVRNLVKTEKDERVDADNVLTAKINNEVKRATEAEKENKLNIESNDADIEFLSGKVDTNIESIDNLNKAVDTLDKTLHDTNATVKIHGERLDKAEDDIKFLSGKVDTNIVDITKLREDLTDTNEHLADTNNKLSALTDRVGVNEGNISKIDTELTRTKDKLGETIVDLQSVSGKTDNNTEEIIKAKERLTVAENDIDALEGRATTNETNIEKNRDSIVDINKTLKGSGETLSHEIEHLKNVDAQAQANKKDIENINKTLTQSGETLSNEMVKLANVEKKAQTNLESINTINKTLTQSGETLSNEIKHLASVDAQSQTNKNDIATIKNTLTQSGETLSNEIKRLNRVEAQSNNNLNSINTINNTLTQSGETLSNEMVKLTNVIEKSNNNEVRLNNVDKRLEASGTTLSKEIEHLNAVDAQAKTNLNSINAINSTLNASGITFDNTIKRVKDVEDKAQENSESIVNINKTLSTSGESLSNTMAKLDSVDAQAKTNKSDIEAINNKLTQSGTTLGDEMVKLANVIKKASDNETSINEINTTLTASGVTLSNEIEHLNAVDEQAEENRLGVSEINATLRESGNTLSTTIDRVTAVEGKSKKNSDDIVTINDTLTLSGETLSNEIKHLEAVDTQAKTNLASILEINKNLATDERDIQDLKTKTSENAANITTNKVGVEENKKNIESLTSNLAILESNVSDIKLVKHVDNELAYDLLIGGDENPHGTIIIPKDKFLQNVSYNPDTKILTFVFITEGDVNKIVEIKIDDLVDTYTAGDGLDLLSNKFSVRRSADSEEYLKVSRDGIKVVGLDKKFNDMVIGLESVKTWADDTFIDVNELIEHTGQQKDWVLEQIENAKTDISGDFIDVDELAAHTAEQQAWTTQKIKDAKQEISDGFVDNNELLKHTTEQQTWVNTQISNAKQEISDKFIDEKELSTHTAEQQAWVRDNFIDNSEMAEKEKHILDSVDAKYVTKNDHKTDINEVKSWVDNNYTDNLELANGLSSLKTEISKEFVDNEEIKTHISDVKAWVEGKNYVNKETLNTTIEGERTWVENGFISNSELDSKVVEERGKSDKAYATKTELKDSISNTKTWASDTFIDDTKLLSHTKDERKISDDKYATKAELSNGLSDLKSEISNNFVDNTELEQHTLDQQAWVEKKNYITNIELDRSNAEMQNWVTNQNYVNNDSLISKLESERVWAEGQFINNEELANCKYVTENTMNTNLTLKENDIHNWVESKKYLTGIPETYITESELTTKIESERVYNEKQFINNDELEAKHYITADALNNKGFLTEHQDISHLATKTELTDGLNKKENIITAQDTKSVKLTAQATASGNKNLQADVKIDNNTGENILKITNDGLYANLNVTYNPTNGELVVVRNGETKKYVLTQDSLVSDATYNPVTGTLDLTIKIDGGGTKVTQIPIGRVVANNDISSPVSLSIDNTENGTQKISAVLKISSAKDNLIQNKSSELYASASMKDHTGVFSGQTSNGQEIINKIEGEINNIHKEISNVNKDIELTNKSVTDLTKNVTELTENVNNIDGRVTTNTADIKNLTNTVNNIDKTVNDLNSNFSTIVQNIDNVYKTVEEMKKKVDEIELLGYQYIGVADLDTVPISNPKHMSICYLTTTSGKYANFGSIHVKKGETVMLKYTKDTRDWTKELIGCPTITMFNKVYDKLFPVTLTFDCSPVFVEKVSTPSTSVTLTWRATIDKDDMTEEETILSNIQYNGKTIQITDFENRTVNVSDITASPKTATTFTLNFQGVTSSPQSATTAVYFVNRKYFGVVPTNFEINAQNIKNLNDLGYKSISRGYTTTFTQKDCKNCYAYPAVLKPLTSITDGKNEFIGSYTPHTCEINGETYYVYILTDPSTVTNYTLTFK